ncbi:MAG: 16S rRNA (cytosine(967)-C(5))-methyltransferase RsmB [Lachnospiraceae bacterium]|nr:16S rRNA (cytosine(967)-C(5))-methyltransferase RsmB [Lachnospiraceae bacterium]
MAVTTKKRQPDLRLISLDILLRTMDQGEYYDKVLHEVLKRHSYLEARDRHFITRLTNGVVERAIELDYIISKLSQGDGKIKPVVRNILRMGVYQIMYMDSVPDSAAVNESVKLAEKKKVAALKGYINGLLRNVVRRGDEVRFPDKKENEIKYYSVWYSMPEWIVKYMLVHFGDRTENILRSFYEDSHYTTVRVNTHKASVDEVRESLEGAGVTVKEGDFFDYALKIKGFGRLDEVESFKEGLFQVQDESSMLDGAVSGAKEEMQILDMCAAPGGKSLHLADIMKGTGKIIACDVAKKKVDLIRENLIRTGIHNVKLKKYDSTVLNAEWKEAFDIVVCDVPCSGLGVLKNKSDIKYKLRKKDIEELKEIQQQILKCAVRYVKPGGTLIYSTCTLVQEENEDNMFWLRDNFNLGLVSIEDSLPEKLKGHTGPKGYIQVLPDVAEVDGFFVAKFVKEKK